MCVREWCHQEAADCCFMPEIKMADSAKWRREYTNTEKSDLDAVAQQVANVQKVYFPVFISAISPTFHPSTHFLNPFRVTRVRMWGWVSDTGRWGTHWTDRKSFVVTVTPTGDVEQSGNLHVLGAWGETRVLYRNSHTMQSIEKCVILHVHCVCATFGVLALPVRIALKFWIFCIHNWFILIFVCYFIFCSSWFICFLNCTDTESLKTWSSCLWGLKRSANGTTRNKKASKNLFPCLGICTLTGFPASQDSTSDYSYII